MNRLLAALMFFTRLPLWRICRVPADSFKHLVEYWPFAGWLTGGVMAGTYLLISEVFPPLAAVLLALAARLLLTGALHEDGLADFFDGFGGGGSDRQRILSIMKDSHIGSYGVIALIVYFLLLTSLVSSLPADLAWRALLGFDVWNKFVASNLINLLSYARKETESKARVIYERMNLPMFLLAFAGGVCWLLFPDSIAVLWGGAFLSLVTFIGLVLLMKRRLQGYTGDCCGATFLLCELTSYAGLYLTNYFWH